MVAEKVKNVKEVRAMARHIGTANLNPITSSEMAKELQKKSVAKRKENQEKEKTFKAMLLLALDQKSAKTGKTKREEINDAIIKKALSGDTKAFEIIRDTVGEKPTDKIEQSGTVNSTITIKMPEEMQNWGK